MPHDDPKPVILEAAINGETRPEKNPHVPRRPGEIGADVRRCLDAGAALIHAHNDDIRLTGRAAADGYLAAWRPILDERPDTLWYPTLSAGTSIGETLAHIEILAREIGLQIGVVDPGSTNIGGPDAQGLPVGLVYANPTTTSARASPPAPGWGWVPAWPSTSPASCAPPSPSSAPDSYRQARW